MKGTSKEIMLQMLEHKKRNDKIHIGDDGAMDPALALEGDYLPVNKLYLEPNNGVETMPSLKIKREVFSAYNDTQWDAKFPPPPVCTARWTVTDWINYVDNSGKWFLK